MGTLLDVFNLKVGDRLIFHVPETEKNEKIRRYDGHIVEIVNIMHVFTIDTFDAVLKFIIRDETNGEERALSGDVYQYLEYAPEPCFPGPSKIYQLEDRIKKLEERLDNLTVNK